MNFLLEIAYPAIDPVFFRIGPLAVRWYGLSYVVAFLIARFLLLRLSKERRLPLDQAGVSDLLFFAMIGTVVGGRLGYVLFYNRAAYVENPLEAFAVWKGGLSFHGGLSGVAVAIYATARKYKVPLVRVMDACSLSATPGILCVRLGNFINAELWGRPSDVPWAMRFPGRDAGPLTRHPSQLYEGLAEGLFLFVVLWALRKAAFLQTPGRISAAFLVGYGILRFFLEYTREPDAQLGLLWLGLSMGQFLCLAMISVGSVLFWSRRRTESGPALTP